MAKATLPTNFKDDILASSMGSKRRYNVINNSDGTISLEDVTDYTQVGSTFGAAQINATNAAANAAADASKIIDDYDTLMANTQAGYMAGALAVKELNSNLITKPKILWTNPSPSSEFPAQTISLDLAQYSHCIIEFNNTTSNQVVVSRGLISKNENTIFGVGYTWSSSSGQARNYSMSDTGITFEIPKGSSGKSTSELIPTRIYGVNLSLE